MNRDTRRTRVLLAVLLLTSVTLLLLDATGGARSPADALRDGVGSVLGPVEEAAAAIVRPVAAVVDDLTGLSGSDEDAAHIAELERDNDALKLQLRTSELARARAGELDRLLRVAGVGQWRVLPARVVAVGPAQDFAWTVTLDAGSGDGLRPDMTVLNGDGLVGRVTSVSRGTSTVLLALDPTSNVGVRLERSSTLGYATGAGRDPLVVTFLDPRAVVGTGDRLVTQGSLRAVPFVAGVPVGEVTSVSAAPGSLTTRATVRPYVDFAALDLVGVVTEPPRTDPRDAVLPPRLPR